MISKSESGERERKNVVNITASIAQQKNGAGMCILGDKSGRLASFFYIAINFIVEVGLVRYGFMTA